MMRTFVVFFHFLRKCYRIKVTSQHKTHANPAHNDVLLHFQMILCISCHVYFTCGGLRSVQCMPVHHDGAIRFIHLKKKKVFVSLHRSTTWLLSDVPQLWIQTNSSTITSGSTSVSPECPSETSPPADHERAERKTQPAARKHRSLTIHLRSSFSSKPPFSIT